MHSSPGECFFISLEKLIPSFPNQTIIYANAVTQTIHFSFISLGTHVNCPGVVAQPDPQQRVVQQKLELDSPRTDYPCSDPGKF